MTASAGERRGAWISVAILALAYVLSYMDRQVLSLLIEPVRRDLGISDTEVSLLTGLAFALCYSAAALPLGRLADISHRRNLIGAGVLVWSGMTAFSGFAQSFWQLFFARMGVGVGEAALPPAAYSIIADLFPPARVAVAMSLFVIGAPLGGGLALIVGGSLVDLVAQLPSMALLGHVLRPWQTVFVVLGLAGLLIFLLLQLVREPARGATRGEDMSIGAVAAFLRERRTMFALLLTGLSLGNIFSYGFMAWLPTLFIRLHGWSLSETGLSVGGLLLVGGCAGALAGGALTGRLYRRGRSDACLRSMMIASSLQLPAAIVVGLAGSPAIALLFAGPALFAVFMNAAVFPTLIQMITPPRMRGQVSAFVLLVTNLAGLGLGPTVYALATDYVFADPKALGLSLAGVSALLLGGALLCYRLALTGYGAAERAISAPAIASR